MPPRSEEEKTRRKQEYLQRAATRAAAKALAKHDDTSDSLEKLALPSTDEVDSTVVGRADAVVLVHLPEEIIQLIMCFLPARELGSVTLTCRSLNYMISECRIPHLLSRLRKKNGQKTTSRNVVSGLLVPLNFCDSELDARNIIKKSLEASEQTGRLVTKKSKKGNEMAGDADEYIAYARYLEEAVTGYATLDVRGDDGTLCFLPPCVQGRFASVSPEHSICRVGGIPGGSGLASWGVGKRGQLGHGKRMDEKEPRRLSGGIGYGIRIVQVSAGGGLVRVAHSLLLTATGRVLSFGCAQYGALGHGYSAGKQLPDLLRPQYIEELKNVVCTCVAAGELHSAVCTTDGDVYTWGDGFCGQLGLGDKRPQLIPKQVTHGGLNNECVLSVTCGARHTLCVTEEGEVFSFGLGHFGALGRSYTPFQYHADRAIENMNIDLGDQNVPALQNISPVEDSFTEHTDLSFLNDEMRRHLNLLANLTLDDNSDQCIPKVIDSLKGLRIVGASAGHRHSIVLDEHGHIYTFGMGYGGALGHGNTIKQDYPMKVLEFEHQGVRIIQISAGVDISMAVSSCGDAYAWGRNNKGQLGINGKSNDVPLPRKVDVRDNDGKMSKVVDVECGYEHSLIITLDGSVYFCGKICTDEEVSSPLQGCSIYPVSNFNIWHRSAEPKDTSATVKWKKYGSYEVKGRTNMMEESKRWGL